MIVQRDKEDKNLGHLNFLIIRNKEKEEEYRHTLEILTLSVQAQTPEPMPNKLLAFPPPTGSCKANRE